MSIQTIYAPTFCSPSIDDSTGGCRDFSIDQIISLMVNGSQIDSYELMIKRTDNNQIVYDTGNATEVLNSSPSITYGGSSAWQSSTNQNIDDNDSNIIYYGYGWQMFTSTTNGYYGNTVHQSSTANDYLQMDFVGTGINCYFTTGSNMGVFEVFIDNISKGTIDNYSSGYYQFKQLKYTINNLTLGSHTIKILVTGNKNASSSGSKIEIDYFQVINTNGAKNSNTQGNYFSYTFTNTGVNVYMDKTPNSGMIDIKIDGVSQSTVDLYSNSYIVNTLIYSNLNLSSGQHTIQATITGNKNTQSKDSYCYFDKLDVLSKTILPEKIQDKQTLNITIPANTITYKGQMKWQIIYWNSDNNGESVTSGEFVFFNMTTPTIGLNVGNTVTSKQFEFDGTYTQNEEVPIKKWNIDLYSIHYVVEEGYIGQNSEVNGEVIDEGTLDDIGNSTLRYVIDEDTL